MENWSNLKNHNDFIFMGQKNLQELIFFEYIYFTFLFLIYIYIKNQKVLKDLRAYC